MTALPTEPLVPGVDRPSLRISEEDILPGADAGGAAVEVSDTPETGSGHAAPPPEAGAGQRRSDAGVRDGVRDDVWGNRREGRSLLPPLLAGIEVTLSVEIGSHRLPLGDLMAVDPGQIFALDRLTSEPVSVLVNGKPFARGEIVTMGDRFGVQLLEIEGLSESTHLREGAGHDR